MWNFSTGFCFILHHQQYLLYLLVNSRLQEFYNHELLYSLKDTQTDLFLCCLTSWTC